MAVDSGDSGFADAVTKQIEVELRLLGEENLQGQAVRVSADDVEFERLHCFVDGHAHAEEVAEARQADLVIWGHAYRNLQLDRNYPINIQQQVVTGHVATQDNSRAVVGQVVVEKGKPYTVHPRATLHTLGIRLRRSAPSMDLASLAHLELPALQSTAPFQLVYFTLGLHFLVQQKPWIAARLFEKAARDPLAVGDEGRATLHTYLGRAYLELPDGAERSIEFSKAALNELSNHFTSDAATLLSNIGAALIKQGKPDQALDHFKRSLTIDQKVLGKKHQQVAVDFNNIGAALKALGKPDQALVQYQEALGIDEALGGSGADVSRDLNNLAGAFVLLGKQDQALDYYQRALAVDKRVLGEDHPEVGTIMGNIGYTLRVQGKLDEALSWGQSALAIHKAAFGTDHPSVAVDLNNLGRTRLDQGDFSGALDLFEQALAIDEKYSGNSHPNVGIDHGNLGRALREQGKRHDAMVSFQKALANHKETLGADHPEVAYDLNNIGLLLLIQGRTTEALEPLQSALTILRRVFGDQHPDVGIAWSGVGSALLAQGKATAATSHFRSALAIHERTFGGQHPRVGVELHNLGLALQQQGNATEAVDCFRRAISILKIAQDSRAEMVEISLARCLAGRSGRSPKSKVETIIAKGAGAIMARASDPAMA